MRSALLTGLVLVEVAIFAPSARAQSVDQERAGELETAQRSEATPPPPTASPPAEGVQPPGPRPPTVELFPRRVLGSAAGIELPDSEPPPSEEQIAEEGLDGYLDETFRRDRTESGVVSSWYTGLETQMRRRFRPDMAVVRGEHQAGMDVFERGLDELQRYGVPERPIDPGGAVATPEYRARSMMAPGESSLQAEGAQSLLDWRNLLNGHVNWYRVELRVRHLRDGSVSSVRVTRSSGSITLDEAAMEAVRLGSEAVEAPPERIVAGRTWFESDWVFEAGDVATDLATAGCVEGGDGEGLQCAALGRGITRTRLHMTRFVDATLPSAEERRDARRARRRERERAAAAARAPLP